MENSKKPIAKMEFMMKCWGPTKERAFNGLYKSLKECKRIRSFEVGAARPSDDPRATWFLVSCVGVGDAGDDYDAVYERVTALFDSDFASVSDYEDF